LQCATRTVTEEKVEKDPRQLQAIAVRTVSLDLPETEEKSKEDDHISEAGSLVKTKNAVLIPG
jgi:hypothetical protein